MKVFGTETEYFLGSTDEEDIDIDAAQDKAATFDEDQNEDPVTTKKEIDHIYAITGMDPSAWGEGDDTSPVVVTGGDEPDSGKGIESGDIETPEGIPPMLSRKAIEKAHVARVSKREEEASRDLARFFQSAIAATSKRVASSGFKPDPSKDARKQAEAILKKAFDPQEHLKGLVRAIAPHLAASFCVGAGAELELTKQAAVRKKARGWDGTKYSEDQPRDEAGRFGSGGGAGESTGSESSEPASQAKPLGEASASRAEDPAGFRRSLASAVETVTGRAAASLPDSGKITEVQMLPGLALGEANLTTGELTITKYTAEEADRFAKGERDETATRGMHVIVHEATHLAGPLTEQARTMQNQTIEEVTTEIVARKVMADEFGVKGKLIPAGKSHKFGAYQHVIKALVDKHAETKGIEKDKAADELVKASIAFRGRKETISDYRTGLFAFLKDLGYDEGDRSGIAVLQAAHDKFHGR